MQSRHYSKDYSSAELMAVVASREMRDGENIFVGIGIPMIAGFLAINSHAPRALLMFEGGYVGSHPPFACTDVGDSALGHGAPYITSLWRTFSDLQRGYCDLAVIGAAQVDKHGNVNSTAIFDGGTYEAPRIRLPGSGGANDMASSAKRVLIMTKLDKRRLVGRVDYVTSPGHMVGKSGREKAGLGGGGPVSVITDKAVFRFENETNEMCLASLYPGVELEDIFREIDWGLKRSQDIGMIEPPTVEQVNFIRNYDPADIILRKRRVFEALDFSSWLKIVQKRAASSTRGLLQTK